MHVLQESTLCARRGVAAAHSHTSCRHAPSRAPEKKGIAHATNVVHTTYTLRSSSRATHARVPPACSAPMRGASASSIMWNTGWLNTWYAGT